jgi:hypothetical protein
MVMTKIVAGMSVAEIFVVSIVLVAVVVVAVIAIAGSQHLLYPCNFPAV